MFSLKRFFAVLLFLIFILSLSVPIVGTEPLEALKFSAKSAVLLEASSGRVLWEHKSHEKLPMASTTKIMTALITLEQANLDVPFIVDPVAIKVEGSSMGLKEGDSADLRTLAWGMLLASGNDAANAAAVQIAGSEAAFYGLMNQKAVTLGMKDTHFASACGLDNEEHYSTAYDMALLTRYALKNTDFAQIVGTKSHRLSYGNPPYDRWLQNHNRLLWQCEDCIGVKTGFTKKAGRCLVSAGERDGLTLIAVTLNAGDDFNLHHKLYDRTFETLKYFDLSPVIQSLSVPITGAVEPRAPLRAMWPLGAYLTESESRDCKVTLAIEPFIYAPAREGTPVGTASLVLNGVEISAVPVVVAQERPSRFIEYRSILQKVADFFAYPELFRFPLE